jgi:hypothetical protein
MDSAEKQRLLDRQKRFLRLDATEQERLRHLNAEIDQAGNAADLHRVMHNYFDWLKTLDPGRQQELADLKPKERVAAIKKILHDQAEARKAMDGMGWGPFSGRRWRMSPQDTEVVLEWIGENSPVLLKQLSDDRRQRIEKALEETKDSAKPDLLRRKALFGEIWVRWQAEKRDPTGAPIGTKELESLRSRLSSDTRKMMEARSVAEQCGYISGSVWAYLGSQVGRPDASHQPLVSDEELAEYFEKLPAEQRNGLLRHDGNFQLNLWLSYVRSKGLQKTPDWSEGKRPDGKRPGPPRPNEARQGKDAEKRSVRKPEPDTERPVNPERPSVSQ